jgi:hypothetical protein
MKEMEDLEDTLCFGDGSSNLDGTGHGFGPADGSCHFDGTDEL